MAQKRRKASDKFITGEEFRLWRTSRGLTLNDVASWLGLTTGAIYKYEQRGVSKAIALAMSAIDRGSKPWNLELERTMQAKKDDHDETGDEEDRATNH